MSWGFSSEGPKPLDDYIDKIAQVIAPARSINEVYDRFAAEVKKLVGFDQINISVINAADSSLTVKYVSGLTQPGRQAGDTIPLSGTETERAAKSRKSFIAQDIVGNITCISAGSLLKAGLRPRMLVPVIWEGQVIGAITLHSCRVGAYGPEEQALLERLAQQIAPVLENARLYEEILKERERAAGLSARLKAALANADAGLRSVNGQGEVSQHSESLQQSLLAAIPDALFRISKNGTYLSYLAPAGFQPLIPSEEFLGKTIESVLPAAVAQPAMDCIAEALSSGQVQTFVYRLAIDDQARDYEARIVANGPEEVLAVVRDVTERKSLEAQFLQSQKMESLGRLAGGIAHDFNNLLGGIIGYASLLRDKLDPESEAHEYAGIIENVGKRGAQLTSQLLTAVRMSRFNAIPVDINEVTREVVQLISRTFPKGIRVESDLQPDLPLVPGDQSQVHQVLMNLCINAADAMPDGGTLTLSNKAVLLGEDFCRQYPSSGPGQYVQLTISDTGVGISEADLPKVFDPFFTTKEPGKGTGLGLAVVYAITRNHGGIIEVRSVRGEGSSFIIYLPVHAHKQTQILSSPDAL